MSPGGRAGGGESNAGVSRAETVSADSSGNRDTTEAAHLQICRFQCLICMKIKICLQLDSATSLHTRARAGRGRGACGLGRLPTWHPLFERVLGRGREHARHGLPSLQDGVTRAASRG